ncbi:MAG: hypothetical protein ACKOAP_01075 [Vulcanococcus sp.]
MALLALVLGPAAPARAQLGIIKLLGGFLFEKPAPVPEPGPSAPAMPGSTPEAQFQELLLTGDLQTLNLACQEAVRFDFVTRLRLLQERLLAIAPAPQPLPVVLVNANALLSCKAPDAALTVLNRFSPKPGPERDQWLIQRWWAAQAGLHHRLAAESLELLAAGRLASLETIALPLQVREDGSLATRPALDVYADHLEVLGRREEAAAALLAAQMPGKPAAERLQRVVALFEGLPLAERDALLERALDQAAAAQAWGLALALLEDQRRLLQAEGLWAGRTEQRWQRLSQRVDDAYSEWQLRRQDPAHAARTAQLHQQLRSPRQPGGHASSLP